MEKTARATKKQRELLAFIDAFIKGNNYGPSYREIMRALGYKSVSTVAVHVNGLIVAGYLRKRDNSARSIEVVRLNHQEAAASDSTRLLQSMVQKKLNAAETTNAEAKTLRSAMEILGVPLSDSAE